ncbi:hypothetical protein [Anoxynatronum sibiricum]|uniref:Uncharacterized protein n=1 Tax=Anoxynatronum sibiricum TaxID=210623 RepID=A0ABU9VYM2_9CLOT
MLKPGLYEQIINKKLYETIEGMEDLAAAADLPAPFEVSKEPLDLEEARKHLAAYIGHVTRKALQMVREQNRDEGEALLSQIRLCNQLIQQLAETLPAEEFDALAIGEEGEVLTAVVEKINSSRSVMAHDVIRPVTPLSESSLFTGSHYEPSMIEEIKREIVSCDQIDWLVSFIKWSGLRCMMEELKTFTHGGGQLRVITTS